MIKFYKELLNRNQKDELRTKNSLKLQIIKAKNERFTPLCWSMTSLGRITPRIILQIPILFVRITIWKVGDALNLYKQSADIKGTRTAHHHWPVSG